jgi:diacylglycerol kinase (ATP)
VDGKDISGKYFLLEIMNIHGVAPGLAFCPAAKPNDGYLHLVVAGEDDRPAVVEALRKESDTIPFSLPVHKFQHLTLGVPDALAHIDDRLRPKKDDELPTQGHIEISVLPAAIKVLAP